MAEKYGQPRRTEILYDAEEAAPEEEEDEMPDYPVSRCSSPRRAI